ncbi:calcium-binding protein [Stagnihabitans tardus]|uniref:Calcium-binding protein n=1 Tax=Stagnihabitans tardus TaxID=2699202 RepID=A0AAE5BSN4_9RHOB|nr:calcium-binding protein [Stagnihabitans tardus]NBZ88070.1 hypothetical protein [Stagnihabitans tardus]
MVVALPVVYTSKTLVVNGDAETGPVAQNFGTNVAPAGWTTSGTFTGVAYAAGTSNDLNPTTAAALQAGSAYFSGGTSAALSVARQTVSIATYAARVDAGQLSLDLAAQLGGFASQDDHASVVANYLAADGVTVLGSVTLTGPLSAGRGAVSTLVDLEQISAIAVGTRSIEFVVTMERTAGSYNDGYADNISAHLVGLTRGQVQVMATRDFSGAALAASTGVSFLGAADATASFGAAQFGAGGIALAGLIEGNTQDNTLSIQMAPGAAFNASRLAFASWTEGHDLVTITGTDTGDRVTGSGRSDVIETLDGSDTVVGGAGNDTIDGGAGLDRLIGGFGADRFVLAATTQNRDTITDFVSAQDKFIVEVADFPTASGLVAGTALGSAFLAHGTDFAAGIEDRFIYNTSNGKLWFDVDGTGALAAKLVAVLSGSPVLADFDFVLI